jgi:hypothetical protein
MNSLQSLSGIIIYSNINPNLYFKSGIKYIKELFNDNGEMYDLEYFTNKIEKKNNIMCEYFMLKQATKPYRVKFDCKNAKYVNVSDTELVLFKDNSVRSVKYLRSDFFEFKNS